MQNQKGISTSIGIIIVVVAILAFGGIFGYQYFATKNNQSQIQSQQQQTANQQTSNVQSKDQFVGWKTFIDNDAGYSLKYPPELKARQTSANGLKENIARIILPIASAAGLPLNIWGFKSDYLVFDIQREKLEDISKESQASFHSGYPGLTTNEQILNDKQALDRGEFGRSPAFSLKGSQKVVKIDDLIYGKEFTILGQFEVCDVSPTRTLIFFKNGYKISVVLQAWAINKIQSELPQYFTANKENCGNSLVWGGGDFYGDISTGKINSETEAGIWYKTFDQILSTIEFIK